MPENEKPPGWLQRLHEASHSRLDKVDSEIAALRSTVAAGFDRMDQILARFTQEIQHMSGSVPAEIATLATDVTALTAAVNAAVTGFATLSAQIAALEASGGLSANDAASLTASVNTVATETAALAAATPAAPAAPAP